MINEEININSKSYLKINESILYMMIIKFILNSKK
jgi:hypothetical protein